MNDLTTMQQAGSAVANPTMNSPLGIFDPSVLEGAMKAAEMLSDSSLVPKDFQGKPGNCLIAIQWGAELGLAPLQAMQNIAVINGRPSIWGDALLALVQGSGALEWIKEEVEAEGQKDGWVATCVVKRRGKDPANRQFTWEDAKTGGLAGKQGPWQQYPKRMLQMRARGFALRDVFADVLKGLYVGEEAQDLPDERRMRDVTPQDDEGEAPKSKADKVHDRVASKKKTEGPALDDVLKAMDDAENDAALEAAAKDVSKFDDADKAKLREKYRQRLGALRAEESVSLYTRILEAVMTTDDVQQAVDGHHADIERLNKIDPEKGKSLAQEIAAAREGGSVME